MTKLVINKTHSQKTHSQAGNYEATVEAVKYKQEGDYFVFYGGLAHQESTDCQSIDHLDDRHGSRQVGIDYLSRSTPGRRLSQAKRLT